MVSLGIPFSVLWEIDGAQLIGDIGVERAAQGDVHHLNTTADPQDRQLVETWPFRSGGFPDHPEKRSTHPQSDAGTPP